MGLKSIRPGLVGGRGMENEKKNEYKFVIVLFSFHLILFIYSSRSEYMSSSLRCQVSSDHIFSNTLGDAVV